MKKILNIFYILLGLLSLASCNSETSFITSFENTMNRLTADNIIATNITIEASIKQGTYSDTETEKINMIIGNEPAFIQIFNDNGHTIYVEEGNEMYEYNVFSDGEISNRKSLGNINDFNDEEYDYIVDNPINYGIKLDNLQKQKGKYVLKGKTKDIIDLDGELGEIYSSLGIDTSIIEDSDISIVFLIKKKYISMDLQMSITQDDKTITSKVKMEYLEPNKEDVKWHGQVPIYWLKDYIDAEIGDTLNFQRKVYKVHFKKGQYAFTSENTQDFIFAEYEIYDSNGVKVNTSMPITTAEPSRVKHTFIIPEDGEYYITTGVFDVNLDLVKLDYTSDFTTNTLVTEGSYSGEIEGGFDFVKFVINSDFDGVYKFTNTGNTSYQIIGPFSNANLYLIENTTAPLYYPLFKGENVFYLCSADYQSSKKINYDFSLELTECKEQTKTDFSELPELPTEPTDNLCIAGYGLPEIYYRLTISKDSMCSFKLDAIKNNYFTIDLYDADTKELVYSTYIFNTYTNIPQGDYIVKISGADHILSLGYIYFNQV